MSHENHVETAIQRYFDALGAGDPEALKACFNRDAVWIAPGRLPNSGVWRGATAIVEEFFPIAAARMKPGSFATNLLSLTFGEANVVVEWEATAETVDGRKYENRYIANFLVEDARISEVREYFDTQRGEDLFI